jgi:hypothetical protein
MEAEPNEAFGPLVGKRAEATTDLHLWVSGVRSRIVGPRDQLHGMGDTSILTALPVAIVSRRCGLKDCMTGIDDIEAAPWIEGPTTPIDAAAGEGKQQRALETGPGASIRCRVGQTILPRLPGRTVAMPDQPAAVCGRLCPRTRRAI